MEETTQSTITPHKGGRDYTISLRLTESELERIDTHRASLSRSDYIMSLVPELPFYRSDDIEIMLPMDMLWQDADPDDYMVDATETAFIDAFERALNSNGYSSINVVFSSVVTTKISSESDDDVTDGRRDEIMAIMDKLPVDYYIDN